MSKQQPTPTPPTREPNSILAQPATVEACRADYKAAKDVRDRLDEQIRGGHR